MIYSKTTEYAIRALAAMAVRPAGSIVKAQEVSRECAVPAAYISKTFLALSRAGILESRRGPAGGFSFAKEPSKIHLTDVINALERPEASPFSQCVMGFERCDSNQPCPLHPIWMDASKKITRRLEKCTLRDMAGLLGLFSAGRSGPKRVLSRGMRHVFGKIDSKKPRRRRASP